MQIRGPFSYSGNKYRIYSKHLKDTFAEFNKIHEPFAGAAVCMYNSQNGGSGIDIDPVVVLLHNALADLDLVPKIEEAYKYYFPNGKTKGGYYKLRKDYNRDWLFNRSNPDTAHLLYLLIQLSFNSLLRFSKTGYNTPYGIKQFNSEKIKVHQKIFLEKDLKFMQGDYENLNIGGIDKEKDVIYFDPPYLASNFKYAGGPTWKIDDELKLLNFVDLMDNRGYKFILSNTFIHKGIKNDELIKWSEKYNTQIIDMSYSSWSSMVKSVRTEKDTVEVIIKNFDS